MGRPKLSAEALKMLPALSEAVQLKIAGLNWRQIGKQVGKDHGNLHRSVSRLYKRLLPKDKLELLQRLELERIDDIWRRVYTAFLSVTKTDARGQPAGSAGEIARLAETLLRTSEQRMRVAGVDKSAKVVVNAQQVTLQQIGYDPQLSERITRDPDFARRYLRLYAEAAACPLLAGGNGATNGSDVDACAPPDAPDGEADPGGDGGDSAIDSDDASRPREDHDHLEGLSDLDPGEVAQEEDSPDEPR